MLNQALSRTKKHRRYTPISTIIEEKTKKKLGDALRRNWTDPVGQVVRGVHSTRAKPRNFTLKGGCQPWRPKNNWLVESVKNAWDHLRLYDCLPEAKRRHNAIEWKPRGKSIGDVKELLWQNLQHVRILLQVADDYRF
jgi:hypothetical protein